MNEFKYMLKVEETKFANFGDEGDERSICRKEERLGG